MGKKGGKRRHGGSSRGGTHPPARPHSEQQAGQSAGEAPQWVAQARSRRPALIAAPLRQAEAGEVDDGEVLGLDGQAVRPRDLQLCAGAWRRPRPMPAHPPSRRTIQSTGRRAMARAPRAHRSRPPPPQTLLDVLDAVAGRDKVLLPPPPWLPPPFPLTPTTVVYRLWVRGGQVRARVGRGRAPPQHPTADTGTLGC